MHEIIESARQQLGVIEVIAHSAIPIPGSVDSIDARAQDPNGPLAASTLRLRQGRLPAATNEASVTAGVERLFGVHTGSVLNLPDGHVTVVGVVENPHDLDDEFVLLTPSTANSATANSAAEVTLLANASAAQLDSFRSNATRLAMEIRGTSVNTPRRPRCSRSPPCSSCSSRSSLQRDSPSSPNAECATRDACRPRCHRPPPATRPDRPGRRRRRRLISDRHRRRARRVVRYGPPAGERSQHRIDPFNLPWSLLVGALVAGVVVPVVAAWWPSRAASRVPIVDAIRLAHRNRGGRTCRCRRVPVPRWWGGPHRPVQSNEPAAADRRHDCTRRRDPACLPDRRPRPRRAREAGPRSRCVSRSATSAGIRPAAGPRSRRSASHSASRSPSCWSPPPPTAPRALQPATATSPTRNC